MQVCIDRIVLIEDVKELIDIYVQEKQHEYDYWRCFRLQELGMLTGEITVYYMGIMLCNMIMYI